jgi:periplasmic copper chaperone A
VSRRRAHRATASLLAGAIATTTGLVGCRPDRGGQVTRGAIAISHAVAPAPASPSEATAFFVIDNRGATADTLLSAASPDADMAMLHTVAAGRMETVQVLAVPPGERVTLAPGGYHLMLHGLRHAVAAGDTLTLQLRFSRAGDLVVRAPVLRYSEAVEELK